MLEDLMYDAIALLLVMGIFFGLRFKQRRKLKKEIEIGQDFVLPYQVSFLPIFLSIIGVFIFFAGALQIAMGNEKWIGSLIATGGALCIWYRFHAHRQYVIGRVMISCVRGGQVIAQLPLGQIKSMVRINHGMNITLLGLVLEGEAHEAFPRPSALMKPLLVDFPEVSVVFSSERCGLDADVILREVQARLTEEVPVQSTYKSFDWS